MEEIITEQTRALENVQKDHDDEKSMYKTKLEELNEALKELVSESNANTKSKDDKIYSLTLDIDNLQKRLEIEHQKVVDIENEKTNLLLQLEQVNVCKNNTELEYVSKCEQLNSINNGLNKEILNKDDEINKLKNELENALQDNVHKVEGKIFLYIQIY